MGQQSLADCWHANYLCILQGSDKYGSVRSPGIVLASRSPLLSSYLPACFLICPRCITYNRGIHNCVILFIIIASRLPCTIARLTQSIRLYFESDVSAPFWTVNEPQYQTFLKPNVADVINSVSTNVFKKFVIFKKFLHGSIICVKL